jgi:hypothetical protein
MKRVLLFTDQADQAEPEILALHGRVTHRALGGRLFVARLPDDVETGRLQFSREVTDPVPAALTLSAQEHSVARAFADMLARQATGTMPPGARTPLGRTRLRGAEASPAAGGGAAGEGINH